MNDDFEGLIPMPDMEIRGQLVHLRQQHQDLDAAVVALEQAPVINQLQVMRLKKQKLVLKDQISQLEARLKPDIIA